MNCECGVPTKTIDTRKIEQGIWRRRRCPWCGKTFTTLEQVCQTVANPYTRNKAAMAGKGKVIPPDVPKVPRPNPPGKRAVALRPPAPAKPAKVMRDLEKDKIKAPWAPVEHRVQFAPRMPERPPVDHITPTARDRIEDMKFERQQSNYGWDTK